MRIRKSVLMGMLLVGVLWLSAGRLCAQSASVTGVVADSSGAKVPDATATLRNVNTGIVDTAASNAVGIFVFPRVPVGTYVLRVEKGGFKVVEVAPFELAVADAKSFLIQMEIGATQQTVQVTDRASLVNTESGETGEVISEREMREMPLNGRVWLQLAVLEAGVVPAGIGDNLTSAQTIAVSAAGGRDTANSFLLDGVNDNNEFNSGYALTPSLDTISEYKMELSQYSAAYGTAQGAVVSAVTKSGTNSFHGDGYEFVRNTDLNARSFFNINRAPLQRNEFGGTFGGPIRKDKTFFFGGYEGVRIRTATSTTALIPTAANWSGNFSQAAGSNYPAVYTVYDPATAVAEPSNPNIYVRQPFPNNVIPMTRFSKVATNLSKFYPAPNYSVPGIVGNFYAAPSVAEDINREMVRIDHRVSDKNSLFFRMFKEVDNTVNPGIFPNRVLGALTALPGTNSVLSWTSTLSPNKVNELRFAYDYHKSSAAAANSTNFTQQVGLTVPVLNPPDYGMPQINITDFHALTLAVSAGSIIKQNDFIGADNFSITVGRHFVTMGGQIEHLQEAQYQSDTGGGQVTFSGQFTSPQSGLFLPTGLPDFLLGDDSTSTARASLDYTRGFRTLLDPYIQDNFKVTPRLTLDLGLRYELNLRWSEKDARLENFDLTNGKAVLANQAVPWLLANLDTSSLSNLPFPYELKDISQVAAAYGKARLAPRVGAAYRLTSNGSTVVRGGWGVFYGVTEANIPTNQGIRAPFHETVLLTANPSIPNLNLDTGLGSPANILASFDAPFTIPYEPANVSEGYMQKWSLTVSRQITPSMGLDVSYIGSIGRELAINQLLNVPPPGPGTVQTRRQWPLFLLVNAVEDPGTSNYEALLVGIDKRVSHGLSFRASYTYSSSIDNISNADNFPINSLSTLGLDRGLSDWDRRHAFVASYVYNLPTPGGFAGNRVGHAILGNWETSGIVTLYSGLPFSLTDSTDVQNSGAGATSIPLRLANGNLPSSQRTLQRWYNTSAFEVQPAFTQGNEGRNILWGPGLSNWDAGLMKNFRIGEKASVQLRGEFFNLLNHAQFGQPGATIPSTGIGQINSAKAGRTGQLALKVIF